MHDLAIRLITRYIEEALFEPCAGWSPDMFERRSYARWAAFELIERIMDNPFDTPNFIVGDFILDMIACQCIADGRETALIFAIAVDTAEEILHILKGEHL